MRLLKRIESFYYDCKNGIHNIIRWLPVVWELRDWDASGVYNLIHKHLNHVEDCLRNYGHGVNSINDADRIKIAKNLCQRLINDEHYDNAIFPVEQKYGDLKWHSEDSENKFLKKIVFDETENESKARSRAFKHAEQMRLRDKDMLFNYLNKYIDGWWD